MSVIRKVPEINKIIEGLTDTEKLKLATEVNNSAPLTVKSLVNKNYYFSVLGTGEYEIVGIILQVTSTTNIPGIVVRTNHGGVLSEHFIGFGYKQQLNLYKINSINRTYEQIEEELNINELRRLLEEVHDHITVNEIDSGSATEGQVLAADGDGGVEWLDVAETIKEDNVDSGDAVKLFGFDAQGNLVADDLPEGILVDNSIIEDSPNAVSGGAVYDANAEMQGDIDALEDEMANKANVDGNYPTMTVGAAENLTPYDEESGTEQTQPFVFQGTGCGNGESQVDTGALALLKEKQGNSVVVNQALTTQILSIATTDTSSVQISGTQKLIAGHKYLFTANQSKALTSALRNTFVGRESNIVSFLSYGSATGSLSLNATSDVNLSAGFKACIFSCTSNFNGYIEYWANTPSDDYTVNALNVIDLTQWFGSNDNIPAHLLAHPEDFFRYYQGSLAYNAGTLVNANGRYLKTFGRNQFDKSDINSGKSIASDGTLSSDANYSTSNYIRIIPNTTYNFKDVVGSSNRISCAWYDGNKAFIKTSSIGGGANTSGQLTAPSNALYCRITMHNDYVNVCVLSIYYEDESGYDQYYPYEELANIDTGTETLRSAGSVKDSKAPDGTITRRVGSYTFTGSESVTSTGTNYIQINIASSIADIKLVTNCKGLMADFQWCEWGEWNGTSPQFAFNEDSPILNLRIYGVTSISELVDKVLFYELATPTTEEGTAFSENVAINDFGSMEYAGANGVPQGNALFYAVDYKAFIDSLYNTLDGDGTDIVKESEIEDAALNARGYYKQEDLSSGITVAENVSASIKKAYKIGNLVFLSIRASVSANFSALDTLFRLASGLYGSTAFRFIGNANTTELVFALSTSDGTIKTLVALTSGDDIYINICYAVA